MQNYPQKQWTNQFHVTGLSLYPPTIIRPRKPSKTLRILQPLNLSKRLLPTLPTGIAIREGKRHKLNFLSLQVWLIVNIQSYQLYTRDSKKISSPLFANFWRPHPPLNKAVCMGGPAKSVRLQVSVRSKYLLRLLFLCQITCGHTIQPPKNCQPNWHQSPHCPESSHRSASKLAELQLHATNIFKYHFQ